AKRVGSALSRIGRPAISLYGLLWPVAWRLTVMFGPSASAHMTNAVTALATTAGRRHSHIVVPAMTRTSGQPKKLVYSAGLVTSTDASWLPASESGEMVKMPARSAEKNAGLNGPLGTLCGPRNCSHSK